MPLYRQGKVCRRFIKGAHSVMCILTDSHDCSMTTQAGSVLAQLDLVSAT